MIQELFGGCSSSSKISNIPTPSSRATSPTNLTKNSSEKESVRCPRCDSPNTKFCYYNNYNLTQPRHFCKTCRRYWTKGGALRNVPIGGGCRKNRSSIGFGTAASVVSTALAARFKNVPFSDIDHIPIPSSVGGGSILWGPNQNSQFLAFLNANTVQNPNPNPSCIQMDNSLGTKEDVFMIGSQEPEGGLNSSSLTASTWMNMNQNQNQGGILMGHEAQHNMNGFQELYQRLRASTNYNLPDNYSSSVMFSSSSNSSAILESAPVVATDQYRFGFGTN